MRPGLLRFEEFEQTVAGLVRVLRPGRLFVIAHANFRFSDCDIAGRFRHLQQVAIPSWWSGATPVYDRDNRPIPGALRDDGVYRLCA